MVRFARPSTVPWLPPGDRTGIIRSLPELSRPNGQQAVLHRMMIGWRTAGLQQSCVPRRGLHFFEAIRLSPGVPEKSERFLTLVTLPRIDARSKDDSGRRDLGWSGGKTIGAAGTAPESVPGRGPGRSARWPASGTVHGGAGRD